MDTAWSKIYGKIHHPNGEVPSQLNDLGVTSAKSRAGLYFLSPENKMNGSKHVELLKEKLVLHMEIHNCTIFMHDGAPCHKVDMCSNFLIASISKCLTGLNPIENLWALMKAKVSEKQPTFKLGHCGR